MIWIYYLGCMFVLAVLAQVGTRWQSQTKLREAVQRGDVMLLEWRDFQRLAKDGQGCLIISTIGHGNTSHVWHPKSDLTEDEVEDALLDDQTVQKAIEIKAVVPPVWCFGLRTILQWRFPRSHVYVHNIDGFA